MADNQKVYQEIKMIADNLCKENKTYLRADLAFELKKYGIASDSSEVSKLVFDAYRYFHDNGNIAIAFVSNNSRTTLVAAENGGYPPTQNGDIRSLFWLFSLMALQN